MFFPFFPCVVEPEKKKTSFSHHAMHCQTLGIFKCKESPVGATVFLNRSNVKLGSRTSEPKTCAGLKFSFCLPYFSSIFKQTCWFETNALVSKAKVETTSNTASHVPRSSLNNKLWQTRSFATWLSSIFMSQEGSLHVCFSSRLIMADGTKSCNQDTWYLHSDIKTMKDDASLLARLSSYHGVL